MKAWTEELVFLVNCHWVYWHLASWNTTFQIRLKIKWKMNNKDCAVLLKINPTNIKWKDNPVPPAKPWRTLTHVHVLKHIKACKLLLCRYCQFNIHLALQNDTGNPALKKINKSYSIMLWGLRHFLAISIQQSETSFYSITLVIKEYIKVKILAVFIYAFTPRLTPMQLYRVRLEWKLQKCCNVRYAIYGFIFYVKLLM